MTTENPYPWADGMNCAVTVCDTGGTILYMNDKARTTFARHGDMIGKNLFDCHSERSRGIIRRLLADGGTNAYTIEKNGVRKMIYQTRRLQVAVRRGFRPERRGQLREPRKSVPRQAGGCSRR